MDKLNATGGVEPLIRSLSRYSERVLLVLSNKGDVTAQSKNRPSFDFGKAVERAWYKTSYQAPLVSRRFEFDVERAIFLTVLHRLFASGSDRACDKWRRDYVIEGIDSLGLHHLYRAMAFLGEALEDQSDAAAFAPRCTKDVIEEEIFLLIGTCLPGSILFFDTTSIYFEGKGGETIGKRGHSKDHRPDLKQIVVGAVVDDGGRPICCEMRPGNTADVKTLIPIADRLRKRFHIHRFCIVADRGMISADTMKQLEDPERSLPYILGARMRKVNKIKRDVLSRSGRYKEVYPEGSKSKDPAPLKVKEVRTGGLRYIVCLNAKQARKDAADRQVIVDALQERINSGPKAMIGNKGYRKYLKVARGSFTIDKKKVQEDNRFDGKWVLKTNTDLSPQQVALKYKQLWHVEHVFRDLKNILETRPVFINVMRLFEAMCSAVFFPWL